MSDDEALVRARIEETRDDLAEKIEAIRAKVDVRHRGEQKLRGWQGTLTSSAKQFRQGFGGSRSAAETDRTESTAAAGPDTHRDAARRGARVRELGQAAVATGWRHKAAEKVAPRVAGSAPMSGTEVQAALGLVFLALSGSYVLKTLLTALRQRGIGQQQPSVRLARESEWPTYVMTSSSIHPRVHRRSGRTRLSRGGQS